MERVGEALRRASGPKRLLLTRVRRPSRQIDDFERGADPTVLRRVALAIDRLGARKRLARQRRLAAREQNIAAAERTHLAHQLARRGINYAQSLRVGDGKREACPLE